MEINRTKASHPVTKNTGYFRPSKIAFVTLSLVLGVTLVSCQDEPDVEASTSSPAASPSPVASPSPTPSPEPDPFQEALNAGMDAANYAQIAFYQEDWQIVAERWQKAIDLLKTVPEDNENYDAAQQRIAQYQENAEIATTKAQQIAQDDSQQTASRSSVSASNTPSPSSNVARQSPEQPAEQLCRTVTPTNSSQPLELNKVQIYDLPKEVYDFESTPESILIGCITNHTSEPVQVGYMSYDIDNSGGGMSSVKTPVEEIRPGQTVPFRHFGSVSESTEFIVIRGISYSGGEMETEVTARRS